MRPKLAGALLLTAVAVIITVIAIAHDHQRAGVAHPIPPPPPPDVSSCLSQQHEPVDCTLPHRWEIVAAWSADDPNRSAAATTENCEQAANQYTAIIRAAQVGDWTARATVVAAVLQAPPDLRAGPDWGWTVCGVQPAWIDRRTGSIASARSVADIPDLFGLCLDPVIANGGSDCLAAHDVQVLGSWHDPTVEKALKAGVLMVQQLPQRLQETAAQACLSFAATMTGVKDPTYQGKLAFKTVIQQDGSARAQLNCLATPTSGRVLIGSVTALGDRPVPLR